MAPIEHLYVHVPFCAAKCHYCAFYSEAGNAAKMGDYVAAVIRELQDFLVGAASPPRPGVMANPTAAGTPLPPVIEPRTIFFGGGTPSLLPVPLMRRLLEAVGRACCPSAPSPSGFTIECNPATVSTDKARLFREFGVNRISLGVQALDDEMLRVLGRVHSRDAAVRSYAKLRAAGFDNLNLDLMFGLPGQTLAHWRETLRRAIALQPEHISTYCLILEEDTEFWRRYGRPDVSHRQESRVLLGPVSSEPTGTAEPAGRPPVPSSRQTGQAGCLSYFALPSDDDQLAMYETGIETLAAAGYRQYEISNFAQPGRECRHNLAYWEGKDYLGLGPSACSTVGNRRWQNVPDLDRYVAAINNQRSAVSCEETLTPQTRAAERAAFGMRMNAGVPIDLVRGRWDRQIAELLAADLVQWRDGRLQPTRRGILFADEVAAEFV